MEYMFILNFMFRVPVIDSIFSKAVCLNQVETKNELETILILDNISLTREIRQNLNSISSFW